MCCIYRDENERRRVVSQFINSGLRAGELVKYNADKETAGEVVAYLTDIGVDFSSVSHDGQLLPMCADKVYCPDGTFSPDRMLEAVQAFGERCTKKGYSSYRGMAETGWAFKGYPGSERLIEYESRVNLVIGQLNYTAICQYDARLCNGEMLFNVLRVHPFMIAQGLVVRNPFYVRPEEFLAKLRSGK